MKKFGKCLLSLLLIFPFAFGLVACGQKNTEEPQTINKDDASNVALSLYKPTSDMDDFLKEGTSSKKKFRLGILDEKTNSDFYDILFYGGTYKNGGSEVPAGYYNWYDVENKNIYEYYEISGFKTTFFTKGEGYYPLARYKNVDFSSFSSTNESFEGDVDDAKNIHRKLNLHHYLFSNEEYNSSYKLVDSKSMVYSIDYATIDENTSPADYDKIGGCYSFLTKPAPLLGKVGSVNIYDFKYVKTGDVYIRIYVDSAYDIVLGADQLIDVQTSDGTVTMYKPLYRTFFYTYDIESSN